MTFADLVASLKDRIERCNTARELTHLEQAIVAVHVGDDGLSLVRFLSPTIADCRRDLARSPHGPISPTADRLDLTLSGGDITLSQ